jgi:hypothetical protein
MLNGTMVLSTVIAMAILMASTAYVVSSMVVNIVYALAAGLGLVCILLSLLIGCQGIVKSLSQLGCEQWNVRMVRGGFVAQLILLLLGLALYLLSLLFIR